MVCDGKRVVIVTATGGKIYGHISCSRDVVELLKQLKAAGVTCVRWYLENKESA